MAEAVRITKVTEVEGFSRNAARDSGAKSFQYRAPADVSRDRAFVPLVRTDLMIAMVQVIKRGGEQELHSHSAMDGFWFVLKGRARFYGDNDVLLAELDENDGIFIPKDFLYWFECVGDEPLELLQVEAIDKTIPNKYFTPAPKPVGEADVFKPNGELIAAGLRME